MPSIAIGRTCDVLNCFSAEEPILSFTAISQRLGLPKSSAHRLLKTMARKGLLIQAEGGRDYRLGYQLICWGMLAQSSVDLRSVALPALRALSQARDETTFLVVREGNYAVCLERVESRQPMRVTLHVGERAMLHAGASPKVLLAFLPEAERRHILDDLELVPLQPSTITSREALAAELATVRAQGYAISLEETAPGTMAIAAPVFGPHA